jgi:acyl-CoA synthetase (AMP-forming)/AMP-acid ligase II
LDGELFITGRLSDLIVIRGKNLFPEDIEATMQVAEPLLAQEGAAAFSVVGPSTEQLVLVQEVSSRVLRSVDLIAMRDEVSRLVLQRHGIGVSAFVPVRAGSLVRTSSGKISRFACKHLYMTQKLQPLPM